MSSVDSVIRLGEYVLQVFVVRLNRLHRFVDRLADVRALGKIKQVAEPGLLGEIEDSLCLVISFADLPPSARLRHFLFGFSELVAGVPRQDQPANRPSLSKRLQI